MQKAAPSLNERLAHTQPCGGTGTGIITSGAIAGGGGAGGCGAGGGGPGWAFALEMKSENAESSTNRIAVSLSVPAARNR